MAALPDVTWSFGDVAGGIVCDVEDWSANCVMGGHDQMRGALPLSQYRLAGSPTQGEIVRGQSNDGLRVWEGRLAAPPEIVADRAYISAQGYRVQAEKKVTRLFISSRDMSQWVTVDADPFTGGDALSKVEAIAGHGKLKWHVAQGDNIGTGAAKRNGFAMWAEGVNLGSISFVMNYDTLDNKFSIQVEEDNATNLAGSTNVATYACTVGNQGATKSPTLAGTKDTVILYLWMNDGAAYNPANGETFTVDNVRVNSTITSAASFNAYEIVTYIANQLGWDPGGIVASTFNALPFDWDGGDWMEAALYCAELEDKFLRVLETRDSGPYVEYDSWGTTSWKGLQGQGVAYDLTPQELFNQAVVWFDTPTGVRRRATATASPDPLSAAGITNVIEYELQDRQADATMAGNVATALVHRYSQQRYAGSITVTQAMSNQGSTNVFQIRPGDTFTITDWDIAASQSFRIYEVEYTPDAVRLGIEDHLSLAHLLAHKKRRRQHHKRKHHQGGG